MGKIGRPLGFKVSDETRALISVANKARWLKIERQPKSPPRHRLPHDVILDAWFAGQPAWQLARAHSASKDTIRGILCRARHAGDPRAVLSRDQVIQSARRASAHDESARVAGSGKSPPAPATASACLVNALHSETLEQSPP